MNTAPIEPSAEASEPCKPKTANEGCLAWLFGFIAFGEVYDLAKWIIKKGYIGANAWSLATHAFMLTIVVGVVVALVYYREQKTFRIWMGIAAVSMVLKSLLNSISKREWWGAGVVLGVLAVAAVVLVVQKRIAQNKMEKG